MIKRRHDWQSRLDAYFREAAATGFAWGESDCCMNAANAIAACTDTDPAAMFRGKYDSLAGAAATLASIDAPDNTGPVEGMAAHLAGSFGLVEIDPIYSHALDVAFLPIENGEGFDGALSVCDGQTFVIMTPREGLSRCSFTYGARLPGARAWRV